MISLSKSFNLSLLVQQWRDDDTWLEDRFKMDLIYDLTGFIDNSEFIINTEYSHYNLELYDVVNGQSLTSLHGSNDKEWNSRMYVRIAF